MKVSLNWLKEFLSFTQSPKEISDALTLSGLEAEGIEEIDDDYVLEVGLTPNLGHCMSIIGIARELSAILGLTLKRKEVKVEESTEKIENAIQVNIKDTLQCNKYCARLIRNVKIKPSPHWVCQKLEKSGLRTVNNVVDIGNLVMLEMGQPLHMFDYDQLITKQIIVRSSKNDKPMTTLDGVKRSIPDGIQLVCDGDRPIALAGVMGELSSSVTEKTQNILIEAAHFTPQSVRKTSKKLNLRSDSSLRFERGIDPMVIETALDFAVSLLEGKTANGIVEAISHEYKPQILEMNPQRANKILGTTLSLSEISDLLRRLEIIILQESDKVIKVQVPSYRNDLKSEIDLIEEVGRMYGFNNIPRKVSRHTSSPLSHAPLFSYEEKVRSKLIEQGLQELLTCDLISPEQATLTAEKKPIHVLHPASIDQSVLRPSLFPSLMEVVKYNLDRQNSQLAAFEVGHIHSKVEEKFTVEPVAAIVLSGSRMPYHYATKNQEVDFSEIKGHVEDLLDVLKIEEVLFKNSHLQAFHPGRQAHIIFNSITLGVIGEVHPRYLNELGISQRVFFAELKLHPFMKTSKTFHKVKPFSLMPASERDWTVSIEETTSIGTLLRKIRNFNSPILETIILLDLYENEKLGKGKKNATFRFRYRNQNKTIEAEEIETEHKRITQHIAEKLGNRVP